MYTVVYQSNIRILYSVKNIRNRQFPPSNTEMKDILRWKRVYVEIRMSLSHGLAITVPSTPDPLQGSGKEMSSIWAVPQNTYIPRLRQCLSPR